MKILILFTGGTIGSSTRDGITAPDPGMVGTLLKNCLPQDPDNDSKEAVCVDTQTPYYILSEELSAANLNLLSGTIQENLHKNYDGILITHGSDTIRYTASALGIMFADSPVPIILICSNYPLSDPRSNGTVNFEAALALLKQDPQCRGVYTVYRNDPQLPETPVTIHSGSRLLFHSEASGAMHSICGQVYAWYENGVIRKNDADTPSVPASYDFPAGRIELCESSGVLQVICAPGALYPTPADQTYAVVLIPYHSGTLPVNDPAFMDFCASCRSRKIPLMMPEAGCETRYRSCESFESLGIIPVPLAAVCLYVRLWIAASRDRLH